MKEFAKMTDLLEISEDGLPFLWVLRSFRRELQINQFNKLKIRAYQILDVSGLHIGHWHAIGTERELLSAV